MGTNGPLRPSERRKAVKASEETQERARELRSSMTKPEVLLWTRLSRRRLGYAFRRQRPIGPHIADFYCHELLLVVEVDGRCHDATGPRDLERDRWMGDRGYTVLRLEATEVLGDLRRAIGRVALVCQHLRAARGGEAG